jgi:hypothetical protein
MSLVEVKKVVIKGERELGWLEKHILELENELLKTKTRQSSAKINELLSDDFIEFCSSGNIYRYNKGDVFDENISLPEIKWEIKEFTTKQLSNECIMATYRVIKDSELNENIKYSLRSSIWKCIDGKWKMIFHQGTFTSEIEEGVI